MALNERLCAIQTQTLSLWMGHDSPFVQYELTWVQARGAIIKSIRREAEPVTSSDHDDLARLRVLLPTSRDVYRLVSYGMILDFEDAVCRLSNADLVPVPLYSRRGQLHAVLRGHPLRSVSAPAPRYDACLLVAMGRHWLPGLTFIRSLRTICKKIIVYLFDAWVGDLPAIVKYHRVWELVDDLFVSFDHAVQPYASALPCGVHYLPQAVEPRWFYGARASRPIDVLSVGRRLEAVHKTLLAMSREREMLYQYQTHAAPLAIDFYENQELVGTLCRASRLHVSWSVAATNAARRTEGSAVTARWFESAASGGVVVGLAPMSPEFGRLFPYPDFVHEIPAPNDHLHTREILEAALATRDVSERQALAEHARTAHSWEARWRNIVATCGV